MDQFEQAMSDLSPATQDTVHGVLATQPETYHCYIKQLVIDVHRDSFAEGVARVCGVEPPATAEYLNELEKRLGRELGLTE